MFLLHVTTNAECLCRGECQNRRRLSFVFYSQRACRGAAIHADVHRREGAVTFQRACFLQRLCACFYLCAQSAAAEWRCGTFRWRARRRSKVEPALPASSEASVMFQTCLADGGHIWRKSRACQNRALQVVPKCGCGLLVVTEWWYNFKGDVIIWWYMSATWLCSGHLRVPALTVVLVPLHCAVPVHVSDGRATTLCPAHEVYYSVLFRTPRLR